VAEVGTIKQEEEQERQLDWEGLGGQECLRVSGVSMSSAMKSGAASIGDW